MLFVRLFDFVPFLFALHGSTHSFSSTADWSYASAVIWLSCKRWNIFPVSPLIGLGTTGPTSMAQVIFLGEVLQLVHYFH